MYISIFNYLDPPSFPSLSTSRVSLGGWEWDECKCIHSWNGHKWSMNYQRFGLVGFVIRWNWIRIDISMNVNLFWMYVSLSSNYLLSLSRLSLHLFFYFNRLISNFIHNSFHCISFSFNGIYFNDLYLWLLVGFWSIHSQLIMDPLTLWSNPRWAMSLED